MTKKKFNNLVQSPKKHIKNIHISEIELLKKQFPYSEVIHNLSLLKVNYLDDINFTETLTISSIYSSNRKNLFELINPSKENRKEIVEKYNSQLFEEWLKDPLLMESKKTNTTTIKQDIKKSTQDNDDLTTETLAKIYFEQEHYERAIQAYKILCLKYPKKSGLFANQIEKIKDKIK